MSEYQKLFNQATERSTRLGLIVPEISLHSEPILSQEVVQALPRILQHYFPIKKYEDLDAKCLRIHFEIKPVLEEILQSKIYLTLGSFRDNSKYYYQLSEAEIRHMLDEPTEKSEMMIHAWLTLPSLEILDFTLCTTVAIRQNVTEGLGRIISKHSDELTRGIAYEPMLVGEDFLKKSGAMRDIII